MTFDFRDFQSYTGQLRQQRRESLSRDGAPLRQAALTASQVTGDARWDRLLEFIEAEVEKTGAAANAAFAVLNDPAIVDHNILIRAKMDFLCAQARGAALREVVSFPARLRDYADKTG